MERIQDPKQIDKTTVQPRAHEKFCQEPSEQYLRALEEAGEDPRAVSGLEALKGLEQTGGWVPDVEARDARK